MLSDTKLYFQWMLTEVTLFSIPGNYNGNDSQDMLELCDKSAEAQNE